MSATRMNECVCLLTICYGGGPFSVIVLIKFKQDLIDNSSFYFRKQLSQDRKRPFPSILLNTQQEKRRFGNEGLT